MAVVAQVVDAAGEGGERPTADIRRQAEIKCTDHTGKRDLALLGYSSHDWLSWNFCGKHPVWRQKYGVPSMAKTTEFVIATPVLASLDIKRSVGFFCSKLGFTKIHEDQGTYGIVSSGSVSIHFWACADRKIAEATGCRVGVRGIEQLYAQCAKDGIVHPKAPLKKAPWGNHEFAILDPDGNLVTFYEPADA
tara:strand:+ start:612 stop:1187 length:576 start_codon:yes stop_codon:yes gene_type:complete